MGKGWIGGEDGSDGMVGVDLRLWAILKPSEAQVRAYLS